MMIASSIYPCQTPGPESPSPRVLRIYLSLTSPNTHHPTPNTQQHPYLSTLATQQIPREGTWTESRKNIPTCLDLNPTFETHPYAHGTDRTEYILDGWMDTPHVSALALAHDLPASTRIDVIGFAGSCSLDLRIENFNTSFLFLLHPRHMDWSVERMLYFL